MNDSYSIKNLVKRGLLSGFVFTILWSSWAYYINSPHGDEAAIRAAFTQGCFTIVNAFIYTVFMEAMFFRGKTQLSRFLLAFIMPNTAVTILLLGIHFFRGTPNVIDTSLPSLIIAYILSFSYVVVVGPRKLELSKT